MSARHKDDQRDKAVRFLEMHRSEDVLILPNAWDAATARVFEEAGFGAIGTTSAGITWSFGYPDGRQAGREETLGAVERIVDAVSVPVTADIEAGYGNLPEEAAGTAGAVIAAGAVGINLEDAHGLDGRPLANVSLQVKKIKAIKKTAEGLGVALVLNARTDVYWLEVGSLEERFGHAVERANAYREAGADCLFVPGVRDRETIAGLVREIDGPLNVLAGSGVPPISELKQLGVARLSTGSGPVRAALALVRKIGEELIETGDYESMTENSLNYAETNRLFDG